MCLACGGPGERQLPDELAPLKLDDSVTQQVSDYFVLWDSASEGDQALCDAIRGARTVRDPIRSSADDLWNEAWDQEEAIATQAQSEIDAAGQSVPGIEMALGAEGIYSSISWAQFADQVGAETPSGKLLRASQAWLGSFGHSAYIDWSWDLGGCANLDNSTGILTQLAAAWPDAPACLQDALKDDLAGDIASMGRWNCYCLAKPEIVIQAAALAPVLDRLVELGGPAARQQLETDLSAGKTRFENTTCD